MVGDKVKLFELDSTFDDSEPLRVATTAVLSKIKSDIEDSGYNKKFTVDALLNKLKLAGVRINHSQLLDLVQEEPWSNLIANVEDDSVKFKGEPDEYSGNESPDDTSDTMEKMAKRASNKKEM